jgi:glycosyltransferase involved in cell wall biosynthesis
MKILVVTQYFPPEPGAPSNRLFSFVEAMVKRGHTVTVVCEFPNYPTGVLRREDRWRLFRVEDKGSYKVIRTFILSFARKNNIKRMLFYLSFAFSSFWAILFLKRHDVIMASSPPIFYAFSSMLASKLKRSKFVLDIRDIWPDSALEVEAVSNSRLLKWGGYLERKIYKHAMAIFTVSKGMREKIIKRGGIDKTYISYNGSLESILNWSGNIDEFREAKSWSDKIIIIYAGILGMGQNIPALLPEIRNMAANNEEFLFIGNGPDKLAIESYVSEYNLNKVKIMDAIPQAEIAPYLHCTDILIVILRETDFFKSAIPSKFFDYMAAGKPIISNVNGEMREIMEKYNTGIYFSLTEKGSFGRALDILCNDPVKRQVMGSNGKKLVAEKFLRSNLALDMVKQIERFVGQ